MLFNPCMAVSTIVFYHLINSLDFLNPTVIDEKFNTFNKKCAKAAFLGASKAGILPYFVK